MTVAFAHVSFLLYEETWCDFFLVVLAHFTCEAYLTFCKGRQGTS